MFARSAASLYPVGGQVNEKNSLAFFLSPDVQRSAQALIRRDTDGLHFRVGEVALYIHPQSAVEARDAIERLLTSARRFSVMDDKRHSSHRARAEAFTDRLSIRLPILLAPMAGACPPSLSIAVAKMGKIGSVWSSVDDARSDEGLERRISSTE